MLVWVCPEAIVGGVACGIAAPGDNECKVLPLRAPVPSEQSSAAGWMAIVDGHDYCIAVFVEGQPPHSSFPGSRAAPRYGRQLRHGGAQQIQLAR
jgi:hypothetical protein